MPKLTRFAAAVVTALAAATVWVIRHRAGFTVAIALAAELLAFAAIAVLVATVTAPVWALVPAAAYLLIQSVSLSRRGSR